MQLRLKMIDRSDYGIAGFAMAYGFGVSHMAAIWLALPFWAKTTMQALFTLALGIGTLTAQYFWRRYLQRRWPDQKPEEETKT